MDQYLKDDKQRLCYIKKMQHFVAVVFFLHSEIDRVYLEAHIVYMFKQLLVKYLS